MAQYVIIQQLATVNVINIMFIICALFYKNELDRANKCALLSFIHTKLFSARNNTVMLMCVWKCHRTALKTLCVVYFNCLAYIYDEIV